MKLFIYAFSLLIFFSSCGDFQEISFTGVESVKLIKLSQQGVTADISVKINNPNKRAFTIYKSDMDVTLGGVNAGKAHLEKNVKIRANSENVYSFLVSSDFTNLSMADIPKVIAMAMKRNVTVGLKGNLKVGKMFIKKNFPFDIIKTAPLDITK